MFLVESSEPVTDWAARLQCGSIRDYRVKRRVGSAVVSHALPPAERLQNNRKIYIEQ